MSIINQFRALGRSTTVAVELALKDPEKNLSFAEKLIGVKNRSNNAALKSAQSKFNSVRLSQDQLGVGNEILKTTARSKGVSDIKHHVGGRYHEHLTAKSRVEALTLKRDKYAELQSKLIIAREELSSRQ